MALSADALKMLGLQREPFRDNVEGDTFYSDPLLDALRERTLERAQRANSVTLIGGEPASGRSLMLVWLLANLDFEEYGFRARAGVGFDLIDRTLRAQMAERGTAGDDRALVDLLADRLERAADGEQAGVVLAIDDADLLDNDTLSGLFRMREKLLARVGSAPRIVLVGQSALLSRADSFIGPGIEVERARLAPFNADQTRAYLRHRLQACGADDPDRLISAADAAELHRQSEGRPGVLNALATRLLRQRADDSRLARSAQGQAPDFGARPRAAGVASGAGGAAAAEPAARDRDDAAPVDRESFADVLALETRRRSPEERPPVADAAQDATPPPDPAPAFAGRGDDPADDRNGPWSARDDELDAPGSPFRVAPTYRRGQSADGDDLDDDRRSPTGPFYTRPWFVPAVAATIALGVLTPLALSILGPSPSSETTREVALPDFVHLRPMPVPEADTPDRSAIAASDAQHDGQPSLDLPDPVSDEPDLAQAAPRSETSPAVAPIAPRPEAAPQTPSPAASAPPAPTPPAPSPPAAPPPQPVPAPPQSPPAASVASDDHAWIRAQSANRYTIQLIAARDLASAQAYVQRHNLSGIRYANTRRDGQRFVVAIAGSFATRTDAEQALARLPAAVRNDGAWLRTFDSLQRILD